MMPNQVQHHTVLRVAFGSEEVHPVGISNLLNAPDEELDWLFVTQWLAGAGRLTVPPVPSAAPRCSEAVVEKVWRLLTWATARV